MTAHIENDTLGNVQIGRETITIKRRTHPDGRRDLIATSSRRDIAWNGVNISDPYNTTAGDGIYKLTSLNGNEMRRKGNPVRIIVSGDTFTLHTR